MAFSGIRTRVPVGSVKVGDVMGEAWDQFFVCTGLGEPFSDRENQYAYQDLLSTTVDRGVKCGEIVRIEDVFYRILAVRDFDGCGLSLSEIALNKIDGLLPGARGVKTVEHYRFIGNRNYVGNGLSIERVVRKFVKEKAAAIASEKAEIERKEASRREAANAAKRDAEQYAKARQEEINRISVTPKEALLQLAQRRMYKRFDASPILGAKLVDETVEGTRIRIYLNYDANIPREPILVFHRRNADEITYSLKNFPEEHDN
jgi:hypothetical protein